MYTDFYKKYKGDKIWWTRRIEGHLGEYLFSFDKKKIYNFFRDYDKLTPEQKKIFDKENPMLAALKN
ncbi:MAG: hypothetical protein Q4F88_06035 [Eubacteriales bacterium]|nr:hypothetical protein [Eubacteriales bacterium]